MSLERFLRIALWVAIPVAGLESVIEWCIAKIYGRAWFFSIWTGSIYFFVVVIGATALLVAPTPLGVKLAGLYLLLAVLIIGWISVGLIPFGAKSEYHSIVRGLVKRGTNPIPEYQGMNHRAVWLAACAYAYTLYFYGCAAYLLSYVEPDSYIGLDPLYGGIRKLFELMYMSFVMMVTQNFSGVTPSSVLAKLLAVSEFSVGLLFTLLIFSLFVDRIVRSRSRDDST